MLFGNFAQPLQSLKKFPCFCQNRHFWGWLNAVFNKVDYERIKAVGPDRAASEWLLRCGALVQYHGQEKWQKDYNNLPTGPLNKYRIKAIDATDSCIMNIGFDYLDLQNVTLPLDMPLFCGISTQTSKSLASLPNLNHSETVKTVEKGLEHVEEIKLCKCHYIEDECLQKLSQFKNFQKSVLQMEIISCGNVTEKGIIALHHLRNLQYLLLQDLPGITSLEDVSQIFKRSLPSLQLKLDLK